VPVARSLRENAAEHGTGYLQIDDRRTPYLDEDDLEQTLRKNPGRSDRFASTVYGTNRPQQHVNRDGRHPANVLIDDDVAEILGRDRRFFAVCAKASRAERDAGLASRFVRNPHPCVKPLALMAWLTRLACPPGGTVLDPFMGSGSSGCAAAANARGYVGIERERDFYEVAQLRIAHWAAHAEAIPAAPASSAPQMPLFAG
jgi:hypothetical protein